MHIAKEVLLDLLSRPGWWLDPLEVGRRLNPAAGDLAAVANQARREELLLAAWDGERLHFPAFQFGPGGRLREAIPKLIQVLPRDPDGHVGLDAVLWTFAPDAALGGQTPAEAFPDDPARVVALARRRLYGDSSDD